MSARSNASITSFALPVLLGLVAQSSGPARAQEASDYATLVGNSRLCIDQSAPAAKRIASCTVIINLAAKGSSAAATQIEAIYTARAEAFQKEGDDQAALRDLDTATKKDPSGELPWIGLGNFYMAKSEYSRALGCFDRAVKAGRKDPVAYDNRGAAFAALRRKDEALADFAQALALDSRDRTALSNRATLFLASGQWDLAIADLSAVIRTEPANAGALYNRGTAYERANALDKAAADYRSALRIQPSFALADEALGRVLARRDPQDALAALTEAIRLDPQSMALRERAILYLSLRQFEPALRDFDQAIANDGSDNIAYMDRGVAKEEMGNLRGALEDYSRSINIETTVAGLVDRGSVYERLAQPRKALSDFDAALALEPNNVAALIGRADANYVPGARDRGLLSASLEDYTRVIEAAPANAAAYFVRGNIHFDLQDYAAAFRDYSESVLLDPDQPATLFNRSLAAEHLGRMADAASDRTLARKLDAVIGASANVDTRQLAATVSQIENAAPPKKPEEPRVAFAAPRAASAQQISQSASPPSTAEVTKGRRPVMANGQELICHSETAALAGSRIKKRSTVCLTKSQIEMEQAKISDFIREQTQRAATNGSVQTVQPLGLP